MKNTRYIIAIAFTLSACGDKGDDKKGIGSSSGSGTEGLAFGQISIASSTLAVDSSGLKLKDTNLSLTADNDCTIVMDIYQTSGTCLTPISVIGYSRLVDALDSTATDHDASSGRIAGIVDDIDGEEGAIVSGTEFDLASAQKFTAYNELWYQYEHKAQYDYISISIDYQKTKFKIKDSYVTMFIPAFQQPLAEWSIWDDCEVPEAERDASRFNDIPELSGMTFQRGDYLFCIKESVDDECSASDFKWLDLDNNELTTTRPENPRVDAYLVNDAPSCTRENNHYSASFSSMILAAKLENPFTLYADFSHGIDSNQWPDEIGPFGNEPDPNFSSEDGFEEPYLLYYYKAEDATSTVEGTGLEIDFDFNVTDSLFVDNINEANLASTSLEVILSKVFTKHDWVFEQKAENNVEGFGAEQFSSLSVAAEVSVTGDRERPVLPEE